MNEKWVITKITELEESGPGGLKPSDVIDNLTSSETQKPLSANQGKVLKNRIQSGTANPSSGFVGTPSTGDIYIKYAS